MLQQLKRGLYLKSNENFLKKNKNYQSLMPQLKGPMINNGGHTTTALLRAIDHIAYYKFNTIDH